MHKLQAWAREHYQVHLELYDAQALSELLCDPEIFWIAEQYLAVPREFRPNRQSDDSDNWYTLAVERWSTPKAFLANPANFYELTSALRHATFTEHFKSDLPLWISCIREFQQHEECPIEFYWRATYEVAVASLRGLGSMGGLEDELRRYFSRINELVLAADLEDASVLAQYCWGAHHQNAVELPVSEITAIGEEIQKRLTEKIATASSVTSKCMYLETFGFNCIMFSAHRDRTSFPALNETVRYWAEMLDLVGDAPLYPLERFADRVTAVIGLLADSSSLEEIITNLDKLLAKRFGGFKAAEKCRDRSLTLQKNGQILRAINELHRAKIAWFAEETLGGSVLTMLMLSALYLDLGLSYAAKQYAMGAAYIAMQSSKKELKRYVPQALMQTARCEYAQGFWCDYIGAADAALVAYNLVPNQQQDQETINQEIEEMCYHTAVALMVAERFAPETVAPLQNIVADWPFSELVEEALGMARNAWSKQTDAEVWEDLQIEILGRPFGDVSITRTAMWRQVGLTWSVSWDNSHATTAVAEQFIATAQVLMTEWAGLDLCLPRSHIKVKVGIWSEKKSIVKSIPSNKERQWFVRFSRHRDNMDIQESQKEAFGFVASIINEVSLLPEREFCDIIEKSFQGGLVSKVEIARPYEELYRICVMDPRACEQERLHWRLVRPNAPFGVREHPELGWFDGPGPGYSKERSEEHIRNRYDNAVSSIRYTLVRLSGNGPFMEVVRRLKGEGWLDWHIVVAVANVTWNYRALHQDISFGSGIQAIKEKMKQAIVREEREDTTPVPMAEYTEEAVRMALRISQLATLKTFKLECRQHTPDFEGLNDFLRVRFNYWTDDVEHEDPFSAS